MASLALRTGLPFRKPKNGNWSAYQSPSIRGQPIDQSRFSAGNIASYQLSPDLKGGRLTAGKTRLEPIISLGLSSETHSPRLGLGQPSKQLDTGPMAIAIQQLLNQRGPDTGSGAACMGLPASGEGVCDRHSFRKMRIGELWGRRRAEKGAWKKSMRLLL